MSGSSFDIARAKAKHRQFYLMCAASITAVFLVLVACLGFMRVISIQILPEEASINSMVGIDRGLGVSVGSKVYAFSDRFVVRVSSDGFISQSIEVLPDHVNPLRVELQEQLGKLLVQTKPESDDTRWRLNGKLFAVQRLLATELDPGTYMLEIDSPYYEKRIVEVSLTRGDEKDLSFDLSSVQGVIDVASVPGGKMVRLNAVEIGATPLSIHKQGGEYKLEIDAPGYEVVNDQIEITNASLAVSRNYLLMAERAYLDVDVDPGGGELIVNGRKVGDKSNIAVSVGKSNTISYSKKGYFSETRQITLASMGKKRVSFILRPEFGKVEILSNPAAEVTINGKDYGITPLEVSLQAVSQHVILSKNGHRTVRKELIPSSKGVKKISVTLKSELQARLAEEERQYKNSLGMELKLFTPSKFTMGAARDEKGQRANEFLRNINLRKPFYVGRHEVTVSQLSMFRKQSTSAASGTLPATSVTWLEAAKFCNWLSAREKYQPFYMIKDGKYIGANITTDGYRLLSEAEWEWLARKAGRRKQTRFTWGNGVTIPSSTGNIADESAKSSVRMFVSNYNDGYEKLAPVGSFKADRVGLYDLVGNVSEWVHDYYSLVPPRDGGLESDPLGAPTGTNHVLKGSNWRSGSLTELRASFREGAVKGRDDLGFRVARYLYGAEKHEN